MTTAPGSTGSDGATPADPAAPVASPPAVRSRLIAVLLSVIIPGAGHVYARRPVAGLVWFAVCLAAYSWLLVPGLIMQGLCVLSAAFARRP
jgi:TM2 domain-containing membrane protein YozV